MNFLLLFPLLFSVIYSSDVLDLKESDFDLTVGNKDIVLVEFFAPWCGHCKKLAPEYEKAATILANADPAITLAKVDCVSDEGKEVCQKYGVSGYPTLKIFRGLDNIEDYNGPRESAGIVKFMKSKGGPASKELHSFADFETFKGKSKEIMAIGFFSQKDNELMKEFMKTANMLREKFAFAHTANEEVLKEAKISDDIMLVRPKHLHSKLEDNQFLLEDTSAKTGKIQTFLKSNAVGFAGVYTADNDDLFKKPLVTVYFNVNYEMNPKGTNYWRNRVIKIAKKFEGRISFAVADQAEFPVLSEMGFDTQSETLKVVIFDKGLKFKMISDFSLENLEAFANDYLDGKIEAYLKSEDIPSDNDGPVKVVVAKNFESIVNDADKDVLIEFYAPWCGHCKSLEPKYKELGEAFANEESVVIAKMDATANDVPPPYDVKGFPSIYFAPRGSKSAPKKYEGAREVKDFIKYIRKESSNKDLMIEKKGKEEL